MAILVHHTREFIELSGLSRRDATVFSFFLAVPTIISAAIYATWKNIDQFATAELDTFVVSFLFRQ